MICPALKLSRILIYSALFLALFCHAAPLSAQSKQTANDPRIQKLYVEAKAAEAAGDMAGAAAKYESILSLAPHLGAAYNNLGLLYFKQREYPKAAEILEKGLKVDSAMPSASALLGISLYEMGKYNEARPRLEAAIRSNPKDDNAELFLANDLIKLEEFENAAIHLQQLSHRQPKNQEVLYLLGKVYMQLSERALAQMNAIDPDSVFAHEISGEVMEGMKNYDGAIVEYKKAVELAPRQTGVHYHLGNAYWMTSQWDAAALHFQAELTNDPTNCLAQWKIGNIFLEQHTQPEDALAATTKAIMLCPTLVQARVDQARALLALNRTDEAVTGLKAAAATNPEEPSIHFLLAQAYRSLGQNQEAKAEMQLFSKLDESARAATANRAQQVIQNSANPQ